MNGVEASTTTEVLKLLAADPEREWSAEDLARRFGVVTAYMRTLLSGLVVQGRVVGRDETQAERADRLGHAAAGRPRRLWRALSADADAASPAFRDHDVMQVLERATAPMSAADIASALGIPRTATLYRLLASRSQTGELHRTVDDAGVYRWTLGEQMTPDELITRIERDLTVLRRHLR